MTSKFGGRRQISIVAAQAYVVNLPTFKRGVGQNIALCGELIIDRGDFISDLKNLNFTYSDCSQNLAIIKYHSQK